ncbi:hypothetical protein [Streptomyces durocortorensis]|uniref:hypothetical protein n=1 Tax=Streptomyces durocortorensis TaxID=2811104 RepID=UPI0027DBE31B|nr:hypothetical protein [Streptomyces durocortorensis]
MAPPRGLPCRAAAATGRPTHGAVAAGGWGLSLLPVHVASVVPLGSSRGPGAAAGRLTRAWRRRRSAGGSGRS